MTVCRLFLCIIFLHIKLFLMIVLNTDNIATVRVDLVPDRSVQYTVRGATQQKRSYCMSWLAGWLSQAPFGPWRPFHAWRLFWLSPFLQCLAPTLSSAPSFKTLRSF
jgi:hypothetical protein